MRIAVIDCGTNTFNLIVIELQANNTYQKLYHTRMPVKLSEEAINKGFIAPAPYTRGIKAMGMFHDHMKELRTDQVLAFATSAIRDASNGKDFVNEVRERYKIDITVIDGNREAELIYFGIRGAVQLGSDTSLIMDIGGGSNEFILANAQQIFWKQSFRIGAARLLEMFRHSDPITSDEKKSITSYLDKELEPLHAAVEQFKPLELVGSSGAFESIVEMIHGELNGEPFTGEKTEYSVDLDQHFKISERVMACTLEERKKIKGLTPMRFDMIVISCLMVDFVLNKYKLNKMRVSTYSLKEGALLDHIEKLKA